MRDRRLARAGRADERHGRAGGDHELNVLERRPRAARIRERQVGHLERGRGPTMMRRHDAWPLLHGPASPPRPTRPRVSPGGGWRAWSPLPVPPAGALFARPPTPPRPPTGGAASPPARGGGRPAREWRAGPPP